MVKLIASSDMFGVWYHERFGYPLDCGHAKQAREVWDAALATPAQPDKAEVVNRCHAAFMMELNNRRAIDHQEPDPNCEACFRLAIKAALSALPPPRDDGVMVEELAYALRDARAVIEHLHPLVKAAGVPPMARRLGVMRGIATSGAHKIKALLPEVNTLLAKHAAQAKAGA